MLKLNEIFVKFFVFSRALYIHMVSQLQVRNSGRQFYYHSSHGLQLCLVLPTEQNTLQAGPGWTKIAVVRHILPSPMSRKYVAGVVYI